MKRFRIIRLLFLLVASVPTSVLGQTEMRDTLGFSKELIKEYTSGFSDNYSYSNLSSVRSLYIIDSTHNVIAVLKKDNNDNDAGCTYFDITGKPYFNSNYACHERKVVIQRKKGFRWCEKSFLGIDKQLVSVDNDDLHSYLSTGGSDEWLTILTDEDVYYNREVIEEDSIARMIRVKLYDGNKLLRYYQLETAANDLEQITSIQSLDCFGNKARSSQFPVFFYKMLIGADYSYYKFVNEYGEPAYVSSKDSVLSDESSLFYGDKIYEHKDEYEKSIDGSCSKYPSVFMAEVVDSSALLVGIRSGDVIMQYDNWKYKTPRTKNADLQSLMLSINSSVSKSKKLIVMRYDEKLKRHKIMQLRLPEGRLIDLGFKINRIFYTQKETSRYRRLYERTFH